MSITLFLFFIVNLFSTLVPTLSLAADHRHHRLRHRVLHQPFFTPTTTPPSEPPEPQTTPPKYPFSTFTPNVPPFFPLYPSPPPPPPSLTAFASNPVNISSLDVPKSVNAKTISPTLLAVTVISLILAVVIVSVAVFFYCRRRRNQFSDDESKTCRSDNSRRLYQTPAVNVVPAVDGGCVKLRSTSSTATSSEFLYLGTLVNSRRIDDIRGSSAGRKMDSPELQPLPPLSRQSYGNVGHGGAISKRDEEEDEQFYSPRGSASIATTRSGSRRVFPSTDVGRLVGTSSDSNRSSSSYSRSPADSISISISPLASMSPRNSTQKSPPPLSRSLSPSVFSSPEKSLNVEPKPFNLPPPPPPPPRVISPQLTSKPPRLVISPPVARPLEIRSPVTVSPETVAVVENSDKETPKPKLKPLHWDKVRASSDHAMVWDQLKSSSFKLDEEMIETLFIVNNSNSISKETTRRSVLRSPTQENRVLDPKKSQNIAISLKALNVTVEEVCEALIEGNADALGTDLLESLLKMAPTKEEERKLKEYKEDSVFKLGTAEKFLREVLDIPFAFKRVDVMLYMSNFEAEVEYLKRSFQTLEVACEELRNSRIFLKLLEAVLKTGNRMNVGTNRGDAHAFKLDTLLKLVDVKGADGKTTLLHFVVQEIIRSEGARLSIDNQIPNSTINEDAKCRKLGLQVVSGLTSELCNVKKAAAMDSDVLSCEVVKLSKGVEHIREVVLLIKSNVKFSESMNVFMEMAEEVIIRLQAQESVALSLVKEITEYFHGNSAREEAHPFRIFLVVKDFLTVLERVCKDVGMINERTIVSSANKFPVPVNPTLPASLPGYHRRQLYSSSDESSSP